MSAPTDRELLELAAKAAGIAGDWVENYGSGDYYYRGNCEGIYTEYVTGGDIVWNPLTDDGDALRLAVKLEMLVSVDSAPFDQTNAIIGHKIDLKENHGADPYAATRRAIVRAAAEIGRTMP